MRMLLASVALAVVSVANPHGSPARPSQEVKQVAPADALKAAVARGQLAWQLSEPDEVHAVLGAPASEATERDGGMEVRLWNYANNFSVAFVREFGKGAPFVLFAARDGQRELGPERGAPLALRTAADLAKLRPFTGLQGADLSRLDLRSEDARLRSMTFASRTTIWPPADRLPKGFDPAAILAAGKNPGLGVRALHAKGIDGQGVTIGIIDQPLVPDHVEIAGRLDLVAELDVKGMPPQMHGPAVTSLAAGASCGVAPKARIAYVSMAMWKAEASNVLYIQALERLLEMNRAGKPRIPVVSISYGGFRNAQQADEWKALLARAEAEGVLVVTCDLAGTQLDYGMLKPVAGGDREKPEGYVKGTYGGKSLLVPADGRTYAHLEGKSDYAYGPTGGMSWAAPYIAGVAALGFQVNPSLTPARARAYLLATTTKMPYGDVINPAAFVEMCRKGN